MTLDELKQLRERLNDAGYAVIAETCRVLLDREIEREAPLDGPFVRAVKGREDGTYTVGVEKTNQGGGGTNDATAQADHCAQRVGTIQNTDSAAAASFEEKDAEIARLTKERDEARDSACGEADEFRATIKRLADERTALVNERDEAKRCLHVEMSMRHKNDVVPDECDGPWRVVDGQDGAKAIRNDKTGQFWFNGYFQASIAVDVRNLLNQLAAVTADRDTLKAALDEESSSSDKARDYFRQRGYPLGDYDNSHVATWCRDHDARREAARRSASRAKEGA